MKVHNFRELKVWQKSIELSKEIYKLTTNFPKEEKYGLISQIQRCSVSIPSNIAEGCGRIGNNELKHFLTISLGSSYELETQIILSKEFGFITNEQKEQTIYQIQEIQKMIVGLYKSNI